MRCSRYVHGGRMHVILNDKPLDELDCFKYLGIHWQLIADVKGMWYTDWMWGIKRGER